MIPRLSPVCSCISNKCLQLNDCLNYINTPSSKTYIYIHVFHISNTLAYNTYVFCRMLSNSIRVIPRALGEHDWHTSSYSSKCPPRTLSLSFQTFASMYCPETEGELFCRHGYPLFYVRS